MRMVLCPKKNIKLRTLCKNCGHDITYVEKVNGFMHGTANCYTLPCSRCVCVKPEG
jgi:hypothetical protein